MFIISRMFMMYSLAVVVLAAAARGASTKASGASGISQFWTDDYKVFDQIYGKTSDKEIYGATLPPASYGLDLSRLRTQASEKKERYLDNYDDHADPDLEVDAYYGTRFTSPLKTQSLNALTIKKPTKSPFKFISADYKQINQNNDPETYNYLRHLEKIEKQKGEYPEIGVGGFKPYVSYAGVNPEESDAYKSIQDILDAHEANKDVKEADNTEDQVKYLNYAGKSQGRSKKSKSRPPSSGKGKGRCPSGSGRCRKRATTTYRVRTRPYLRRIKHKIISY